MAHLGGRDLGIQKAARFVMYNIRKGERENAAAFASSAPEYFICVLVCIRVSPFSQQQPLEHQKGAPPRLLLPPLVLLGGFAKIHPLVCAQKLITAAEQMCENIKTWNA